MECLATPVLQGDVFECRYAYIEAASLEQIARKCDALPMAWYKQDATLSLHSGMNANYLSQPHAACQPCCDDIHAQQCYDCCV